MSLRDRLLVLSQGVEGYSAEEVVAEWQSAVVCLFDELKSYLVDYIKDNLLTVEEERIPVFEERLGAYEGLRLKLRSGSSLVNVTPVGRIVAGAVGRVDMSNAGWPGHGYMLLRQRFEPPEWQITHRESNPFIRTKGGPLDAGKIVFFEPLSKSAFEQALESLFE
ncbi:hypothetical protein [Acidisoma cladoniae]|jgi:hypothetical protein|uniref:hypothetical protein n=1 Tax=Acidisoma cladoniae TaxID=3040935 RepID=UPI00254CE4A1|nr:hypothetical protein [Acidisoma sp. PAMC 29798]